MPIDPAGTTPGLKKTETVPKEMHVRCKNPQCDSILAIELKIAGQEGGRRMYQCCKCKHTWGVVVGGFVEL
jgi:hypothetical protein